MSNRYTATSAAPGTDVDGLGGGAIAAGDISDAGTVGVGLVQSETASDALTALGGAAALRALLDAVVTTYTLGGSTTDYTAAAAYAPSGITAHTGTSVSGRLGDGTDVPFFSVLGKGGVAALARNASGVRITHTAANTAANPWPYSSGSPALVIPLAPSTPRDVQVDLRVRVNFDATRAVTGTDTVEAFLGITRYAKGERDFTLGGVWIVTHYPLSSGAVSELAYALSPQSTATTTETARDVSSAGEGTTAGITARDVRIVLKGPTVEVLTGPAGGSLTQRVYYADVAELHARDGLAVTLGISQNQATPLAGYYAQIEVLTVTPL